MSREDRHEIGVAVPARDNVDVEMIGDARAGGAAEIDSDVESVRLHHLGQGILAAPGQFDQIAQLLLRQPVQIGRSGVRHDEQMSAIVGIAIEHGETSAFAHDDIIGDIIAGLGDALEKPGRSGGRFGSQNVGNSPRRVQRFHQGNASGLGGNCQNQSICCRRIKIHLQLSPGGGLI